MTQENPDLAENGISSFKLRYQNEQGLNLVQTMAKIKNGVKAIVRKDNHFLILVKPNGLLDLPGGRVENGESIRSALQREIDEETGLKVAIQEPVEEWSFLKKPDLLIKGITFACTYIEGKVRLCEEHTRYFWAGIDSIPELNFSRNILSTFRYT